MYVRRCSYPLHLLDLLKRRQQQDEEKPNSSSASNSTNCGIGVLIFFAILLLALVICLLVPTLYPPGPVGRHFSGLLNDTVSDLNSTKVNALYGQVSQLNLRQILSITALCLAVFLALLGLLCAYCCKSRSKPQSWSSLKLLFIAAFTKLPTDSDERAIVRGDDDDVIMVHDSRKEETGRTLKEKLRKIRLGG